MSSVKRLYFDQAATTWPKLPEAVAAAQQFVHECGATSGRGAYASARTADRWITQARHNLARLLGAEDASQVALCTSGTHALNAVLLGLLEPNDRVLTTAIEHNSVLRPLEHLRTSRQVEVGVAPCDASGWVDIERARELLRQGKTRAVVISHASNVTGRRQDIRQWSQLAHEHGALLIVDASQTVGYVPISMHELGIDALASAGHKGLGAMAGTGFLIATSAVQTQLRPLMYGGTGTSSEQLDFVPRWPQSIEVGNANLPGVVSMAAAAEVWLREDDAHLTMWQPALNHFVQGLHRLPKVDRLRLIGHDDRLQGSDGAFDTSDEIRWLPILSLELDGWDIHEASAVLDGSFGTETRAGYHCAALIHAALGTAAAGGTLRFSLGHKTSLVDVDDALHALGSLL